jgi:catalase
MSNDHKTLTTRQGHPVTDNQSLRSVGERGPATLENYQFIEKITHFDRERIPERVVHARGTGAHGYFEAYGKIGDEPASKYTRAKVLTQKGVKTPVFVRFSTVAGAKESPETARDPRGFAVKFKTVDGNWDLVGNNLKIFFIRDAVKFPDMIHAFKPDPITNRQEAWRFFDFVMHHPESLNMVTWLKSPWGIPANYREMEGSSVNTYKLVNDQGEAVLVKFSFEPKGGRAQPDSASKPPKSRRRTSATPPATSMTPSSAAILPSGSSACRSWRMASIPSSISTRSTTPSAGRRAVPPPARRPHGPEQEPVELLCRSGTVGVRYRAFWSTASTSPPTRCCRAARCPIPIRSATGSGPNYLQLPINAPQEKARAGPRTNATGR